MNAGLQVSAAAVLAAAALGLVTTWIARRGLRGARPALAWVAAAARGAAVALAVLAVSEPFAVRETSRPAVRLVAAPVGEALHGADLAARWPLDAPDAASALAMLRAARDPARPADLLLVTDGDVGAALASGAAEALRPARGVRGGVLAVPASAQPPALGAAPRIRVPAGAVEGVPVVLHLDSGETPFADTVATVRSAGRADQVPLSAGGRRVVLPAMELPAGARLVIVEVPGRLPAAAVVHVAGAPDVAVVADDAARGGPLVAALRAQGLQVRTLTTATASAAALGRASVVVIGPGAPGASGGAVAERVREGAGLLVVGGPREQGLGRLRGTALEPLLPVTLPEPPPPAPPRPPPPDPPKPPDPETPKPRLDEGPKEALRVALLLVIDRSGSMAGPKLTMAQLSGIAAARALSPKDRVGVIAFDDESTWVAPFQDAVEMTTLARRISSLRAGGGTNFFPALRLGYRDIVEQPVGIRHVILLTDGATRTAVFRDMVEAGAAAGVTLSAVAVGEDADTHLLGLLAGWGRGRLYLANDPRRLPEIVTLDTLRFVDAGRKDKAEDAEGLPVPDAEPRATAPEPAPAEAQEPPPGEEPETPALRRLRVASAAAFLAGLEEADWPRLPHAEAVAARVAAHVALEWEEGGGALVLGRAGLGRVAVLAADVTADATELWAWDRAGAFVGQLVRGLAEPPPPPAPTPLPIHAPPGGRAVVHVAAPGGGVLTLEPVGGGSTLFVGCAARGEASVGELPAVPPLGVFAGTFSRGGAEDRTVVAVSPGPRPPETTPASIATAAGVPLLDEAPERREGEPERRRIPFDAPLLCGAVALLLAEAAFRRAARSGS